MGFLDFLFPKYCVNCKKLGSYLCANCFSYLSFDTHSICLVCNKGSSDGFTHSYCRGRYVIDGCFSAIAYKGVAKKLIFQFKYKPYLSDLKTVLSDLFYESLIQQEGFQQVLQQQPILVSIPLHGSKLKSRGYNHAQILSCELAKRFNLRQVQLLKRTKLTSSQFGLKRKKRIENVADAFAPPATQDDLAKALRAGQYPNIFLVDDILTTGATLSEAARVLKKAGAKRVWGLALARD